MSFIENIRNKPQAYKIRLMWIIIVITVIILLVLWIVFNRIGSNVNTASKFFKNQVGEIQTNGQKMYEENK